MMKRRISRGTAFLQAVQANRKLPGHCSRCGRPNPEPAIAGTVRGKCPVCREYFRQWNARHKQVKSPPPVQTVIVDPVRFHHFEERIRDLERMIKDMKRYARAEYQRGYLKGVYRENRRWSNMPRQWDSWNQPIDIEDKKQHFHRLALAVGEN